MLDIHFIRQNKDQVQGAIAHKQCDCDLDALLETDRIRRELIAVLELQRARKNELAAMLRTAEPSSRPALFEEARTVRSQIEQLEPKLAAVQAEFDKWMLRVPNIPHPDVPIGKGEEDNVEVRRVGSLPQFDFAPQDHVGLMTSLSLVDWDGPRRFAGGRTYALIGHGALLELAIVRMAVDLLMDRGWTLVSPPVLVKEQAMIGTGYFPLGRQEAYCVGDDELFLVGTSEVSLVSLHAGTILDASALPLRYAGFSPCFRREAGAHGRDTRGIYRVHQFTKVEQVIITLPDEEEQVKEHEGLLTNAEAILAALEIPYRVCLACTGEIGLGQVRKHEIESWMPGRNAYGETHSCSSFGDFQARRSQIRVRLASGALAYAYTLNNTTIALPRILIPLLENHQQKDGSVKLPKALVPYMRGIEVLRPVR
ncbi:serine--tRNA ligase [Pajaroellobacter abortibovis]|uniref:Serine--tRNA ligase n=1 Tax=Pajaroellobacter abortibovis TaxID=1882918 RepID=A0A1L6MW10_9BACT|nr:serine--tRNA ligase [Pajaroellobacter abortibovis]APR99712.1 serine--tRNA ligase [Pajaroellobacter abortibovis]